MFLAFYSQFIRVFDIVLNIYKENNLHLMVFNTIIEVIYRFTA